MRKFKKGEAADPKCPDCFGRGKVRRIESGQTVVSKCYCVRTRKVRVEV